MQAGDNAAAIALMKAASGAKPDELDLQFQLGSLHERAGDHKAAEEVFLALLKKDPEHAPTLNYLGYMWAESGKNLEQAHEMLVRAVGKEPNNGAYVDSLGWVYFRLGNLDLAEKYLTDATTLLPRDATVHEHLGDVLAKRGDKERALRSYRTALSLDPEPKEVGQAALEDRGDRGEGPDVEAMRVGGWRLAVGGGRVRVCARACRTARPAGVPVAPLTSSTSEEAIAQLRERRAEFRRHALSDARARDDEREDAVVPRAARGARRAADGARSRTRRSARRR